MSLDTDPVANGLAARLVEDTETQRRILDETLSAEASDGITLESGRTICAVDDETPEQPTDRRLRSVDLETCPADKPTGIFHTHTTPTQLRYPEHSLPDIANVVFGPADASIVVGTRTSSVLMRAADPEAMQAEFRNAVGIDAESADDVVEAIETRRIADPPAARRRLREAFDTLYYDVDTPYPEFDAMIAQEPATPMPEPDEPTQEATATDTTEATDEPTPQPHTPSLRSCDILRRQSRSVGDTATGALTNYDVGDVVVGTVVGQLTSTVIERVVFDQL